MNTVTCPTCHGHGKIKSEYIDGAKARQRRQKAGLTLGAVADHMDISHPHLSDMELGKRRFTPAQMRRFEAAIRALSK